ncbi:MAG TPA: response regulator transcription factor [Sedimenticola sp.]|nr:response regulator transcription factor [Sedimenticola sp.]
MQASDRFLIVDDDVTFCSVLEQALTRRGYSVATAHDADQALKTAEEFQPTHAVIDLKLEGSSGLHLIKPFLALNGDMKAIVLTGYGSIPTAVQAIKEGAVNYLAKPADVESILAAFDKADNSQPVDTDAMAMSLKRLEWEHIQRALNETGGNISATARKLGMHRRTLQRKLQKRPVKQ